MYKQEQSDRLYFEIYLHFWSRNRRRNETRRRDDDIHFGRHFFVTFLREGELQRRELENIESDRLREPLLQSAPVSHQNIS